MRITALAGGVGGARFLRGLLHHARQTYPLVADPDRPDPLELTVIGNTGDDITLFGLRVCPDIDTLLYTLGGGIHEGQGWGRADESHHLAEELAALGAEPQWFTLGDKDFGTHVYRSQLLGQGMPLSGVVDRLSARWGLGDLGVRLLPMTDTPVETHVVVTPEGAPDGEHRATPAPGVLDAIREADVVILPPSNPVVSIGIILGVPGVRDALRGTRAPVVGVSPLVGGRPVRGHADVCLRTIGVDETSTAVAGLYADFLDGWLVDEDDPMPERRGLEVVRRPLRMSSVEAAADMAGAALELGLRLRAERAPA